MILKKLTIGIITSLSLFAGSAKASTIDLPPQAMTELSNYVCAAVKNEYSGDYIYDQLDYQLKTHYQDDYNETQNQSSYDPLTNDTVRLYEDLVESSSYKNVRRNTINIIAIRAKEKCPQHFE